MSGPLRLAPTMRRSRRYLVCSIAAMLTLYGVSSPARSQEAPRPVTFNRDVAPLIFKHCAICHRPGQAAPFNLQTYQEVKKHDRQIAEVIGKRYMPPWLPEPDYGEFMGNRRLAGAEIKLIQDWVAEGSLEGKASDLPPTPTWESGWLLGKPDLVATLPKPYTLPAEGVDVYRNFVIPLPLPSSRYVRAVDFNPGNWQVAHHVFIKFDPTRESRRMDEQDEEPGFPGMNIPARMPDGQFLTWQPGKLPVPPNDQLSWRLGANTDLVLQMHMRPSGKPELVQPSVAIYFTDTPPTNRTFKVTLTALDLDIPADQKKYVVEDDFVLPIDVQATAVLPHAHYLAKEMQGWAILPGGEKKWLLYIKDWDFNWQGDYRYAAPILLPRGTALHMRFTYDNTKDNPRNPNHPPKRVVYGPQTSDEMAELWFQLLPLQPSQLPLLERSYNAKMTDHMIAGANHDLKINPRDAKAHTSLGLLLFGRNQVSEAKAHLSEAIQLSPQADEPHYYLGLIYRNEDKSAEARAEFETVLRLNPNQYKAHGNLGLMAIEQNQLLEARDHFRSALKINPDDALAREYLAKIEKALSPPH